MTDQSSTANEPEYEEAGPSKKYGVHKRKESTTPAKPDGPCHTLAGQPDNQSLIEG